MPTLVKDALSQTHLPRPKLSAIWNLVDDDKNGKLDRDEVREVALALSPISQSSVHHVS